MNEVKLEYNRFYQERMFFDNLELSEDQKKVLDDPIPIEALRKIERSKLTDINPVFAYDLLNRVFGENGYVLHQQIVTNNNGYVVVCLEFYAPKYNIYHIAYGGSQNQKELIVSKGVNSKITGSEQSLGWADSAKGAFSDALKNIVSRLSSGWRLVWKNQHEFTHEEEPVSKFAIPVLGLSPVPSPVHTIVSPPIPMANQMPPKPDITKAVKLLDSVMPPSIEAPIKPPVPNVPTIPVAPNVPPEPPKPTQSFSPPKPPEPPKPPIKKPKPAELANSHQLGKIDMPNLFNEIGGGETEFAFQLRKDIESGKTSVFDQSVKYNFTESQKKWLNALVDELPF